MVVYTDFSLFKKVLAVHLGFKREDGHFLHHRQAYLSKEKKKEAVVEVAIQVIIWILFA